jgi:hypothetical protein
MYEVISSMILFCELNLWPEISLCILVWFCLIDFGKRFALLQYVKGVSHGDVYPMNLCHK